MNRQHAADNSSLESTIRVLCQLSPQSQEIVAALVRQLAEREGINVPLTASSDFQTRSKEY